MSLSDEINEDEWVLDELDKKFINYSRNAFLIAKDFMFNIFHNISDEEETEENCQKLYNTLQNSFSIKIDEIKCKDFQCFISCVEHDLITLMFRAGSKHKDYSSLTNKLETFSSLVDLYRTNIKEIKIQNRNGKFMILDFHLQEMYKKLLQCSSNFAVIAKMIKYDRKTYSEYIYC